METAGRGTPPTIESSENRTGADANAGGGLPAGGQDMGATADAGGMNKTEGAQAAQKGAPTNGARPRGRLCLNKQEKKRGLLNKPG